MSDARITPERAASAYHNIGLKPHEGRWITGERYNRPITGCCPVAAVVLSDEPHLLSSWTVTPSNETDVSERAFQRFEQPYITGFLHGFDGSDHLSNYKHLPEPRKTQYDTGFQDCQACRRELNPDD